VLGKSSESTAKIFGIVGASLQRSRIHSMSLEALVLQHNENMVELFEELNDDDMRLWRHIEFRIRTHGKLTATQR